MKTEKNTFKLNPKKIPNSPGCYIFKDKNKNTIYIGKAKDLKKRISSYFQKTKKSPKTNKLVSQINEIETRIVHSETEALLLENNLIKEFRPKFNVLLRDDKNFLYLRITNESFPRLETTRKIIRDGSFYCGPKTSAQAFRKTIAFCQKVFQIRTCRLKIETTNTQDLIQIISNSEKRKIPCLDHQIKKCTAPCANKITKHDYQIQIEAMKSFLRGNTKQVIIALQEKMQNFAKEKNFEAAAKTRDLISSIETSTQKQTVQFQDQVDRDFINFERTQDTAFFIRIAFRNGKLLHQNEIEVSAKTQITDEELLEQFCLQFYEKADILPKEIYLPKKIDQQIELFLSTQYFQNTNIKILVPQKGDKKKCLEIAWKNAKNFAQKSAIEKISNTQNIENALPELKKALNLKKLPKRMECYDISHLSGTHTTASQVVFIDGVPKTSEYRRYKVKTLQNGQIDDFAAMEEILTRRFAKKLKTKNQKPNLLPDLIIIDGGKGQLSSVMKAAKKQKFPKTFNPKTQIIALAKKEEQIHRPTEKAPLELPPENPALKLLQRIRDEAHRFALSYNRNLRKKSQTKSLLDEVQGIGSTTKKALLQTFGSVLEIKKASDEALLKVLNQKQLEGLRKIIG